MVAEVGREGGGPSRVVEGVVSGASLESCQLGWKTFGRKVTRLIEVVRVEVQQFQSLRYKDSSCICEPF
jgi:hypothetical protein